jgi:hypothetical protein
MRINNSKVSSRRQVQIKEVKDNVLILPGNHYRTVLETSSVNFELKSEDEQDVLIDNFQNFLNSLPCTLQILIRVREVDTDRYLEEFSKSQGKDSEKVYRDQMKNYCDFIRTLVSGNKILSRRFYVVIPYTPTDKTGDFDLIKEQILLSQDIVAKGLEKLGMKTRALDTFEILELFYKFYNFDHIKSQELKAQTFKELFNNSYAI